MNGDPDQLSVLLNRTETLRALVERPQTKPDLVDRLGVSRSTVDRAIRDLEDACLVMATDGRYAASAIGRTALQRYDAFRTEATDVFDATEVLSELPLETDVPVTMLVGAETIHATETAPYRPVEQSIQALEGADSYRAILPALADTRQIRVLHDRIVSDGATAELVIPPSVLKQLDSDFQHQLRTMAGTDRFVLRCLSDTATVSGDTGPGDAATTLPYGVALVGSDGDITAQLLVHRTDGSLGGIVTNASVAAVDWATSWYETVRERSTDITDQFQGAAESPRPLPASLQREGFVRLSSAFFADRTAGPASIAWRAGLDLTEVYAGFAVERTDPTTGEPLTTTTLDTLRGKEHCVVIGPPGIGKSTVCKQVACAWYAEEMGPVLYRSAADGNAPFESVDELIETVHRIPGRPLIVVEDAIRPDAAAIAEVIDRLDRSAAAVLLDAREEEWTAAPDTERGWLLHDTVETVRLPTLSDRDRRRLVEQVETTLKITLPDTLSALDPDAGVSPSSDDRNDDTPATDETPSMFLHRLVTDAVLDDFGTGAADRPATTLEAEFERLFDDLTRIDELAAGLTVNLFNAAGISVEPSHARAIAEGDGDSVLDTLGGSIFLQTDAGSRTVHHAWSIRFLTWAAEHHPEEAAAATERGVACIMDVGTDPVERAALRTGADDTWLDTAADDPTAWVALLTRRLFRTLRSIPALSPLFESEAHRVRLPDSLSPEVKLDCQLDLAKTHTDAHNWERAAAALTRAEDRLANVANAVGSTTCEKYQAEIAIGRGTLARQRGDLETAEANYRTALEHANNVESPRQRGRARNGLGAVAGMSGTVDEAVDHFEDALAASRAADDLVTQSNVLRNLGNMDVLRGDHETAVGYYEESISLAKRYGLGAALAGRYVSIGEAHLQQAAYDAAETAYTQGLQLARRVGAPGPEANAIGGLGELALERGDLAEAEERFTHAVELFEALDRPRWLATATHQSGEVARRRGDVETALDRLRAALTTAEAVDDTRLRAKIATDLGLAELEDGDLNRAEEHFRQALREWDDTGLEAPSGRVKRGLAAVAFERGDIAVAERQIDEALARLRKGDRERDIAEAKLLAGRIAADRDDPTAAHDSLSAAVERFRDSRADDRAAVAADELAAVDADRDARDADTGQQ